MEFLDSLVKAFDGCVGLLEVLTLCLDAAALYLGLRNYQRHRHAVEKLAHDPKAHVKKPNWWPVVALAVLGVAFTALLLWKYRQGVP